VTNIKAKYFLRHLMRRGCRILSRIISFIKYLIQIMRRGVNLIKKIIHIVITNMTKISLVIIAMNKQFDLVLKQKPVIDYFLSNTSKLV